MNIKKAKENIELFKKAKNELLSAKEFKTNDRITADRIKLLISKDKNNQFKNLKSLYDLKLITTKDNELTIDLTNSDLIDFYIWNSKNASDIISFDKDETWKEKRSTIGLVDDTGFNELLRIDDNWYFVSIWWDKE
ncbi:MAG: hypothetical protein SFU99_21255 [Saprospiraceae bacterium]|nr:hypothetical protein [Saprospiraceae bacterium]